MTAGYRSLDFTERFLETLVSRDFSAQDRQRIFKALRLLDENERHPSLRVHTLEGDREGSWPASVSDVRCITFERLGDGRKRLLTCSCHYAR